MGNISSTHRVTAQDKAILDLKVQRDKVRQYQKRITKITDRETEVARECLARNNRRHALLALRRKKYQESLLSQTDAELEQLGKLVGSVEFALVQKDVLFGLKRGTQVLNTIHAEMGGLDGVGRLMEENAEARAYQEELSQMLGGQLSNAEEEEAQSELQDLVREVTGAAQEGQTVELPEVPSGSIESKQIPTEHEGAPMKNDDGKGLSLPA